MAKITVKNIDNHNEWETFISSHPEANFLQSWYWGEFHIAIGNKIHRIGFYIGDELVGVMLTIVEDAKRGRYVTIPGGPIIDWKNLSLIESFITAIKNIAASDKCVFVRVRPQLKLNDSSRDIFSQYGFVNAPIHLHAELTSQLDITKSEEELLANMRKATRYEIKKSVHQGIKVTTSTDAEVIKEFYDMQLLTAKRQGFIPFSYNFLYEQFKVFAQRNYALLYKAEFEDKLLAEAFIIFYGNEAIYHYGASTDEGRKYPGAYLIQWEAIKEAKRRGISRYNFWGVAPENNKGHRFYGLSIFKRGFGGSDFHYLNAQDLVVNTPRYIINRAIENIRKRRRSL